MAECEPCLGGGVGAGDSNSGGGIPIPPVTDQEVQDAVRTAFFLDPVLPEHLGDVISIRHVVYLRGIAPTRELRQRAETVAAQVQGVERVVNELTVAQPEEA
jgi:osmotically-inducible protein OsmY